MRQRAPSAKPRTRGRCRTADPFHAVATCRGSQSWPAGSRNHPWPSSWGTTRAAWKGLIAGSGTSYFSDLLNMAGGTNIFADAATPYPKISLEECSSRNPDVILELSGEGKAKQEEVISVWQTHRTLKAVANGPRVCAFRPDRSDPRSARAGSGQRRYCIFFIRSSNRDFSVPLARRRRSLRQSGSAEAGIADIAGRGVRRHRRARTARENRRCSPCWRAGAPSSGTCRFLENRAAHQWPRRDFARRVAVVQQAEPSAFPFTAEEVVYMGRMPHRTGMYETAEDHAAVAQSTRDHRDDGFRAPRFPHSQRRRKTAHSAGFRAGAGARSSAAG